MASYSQLIDPTPNPPFACRSCPKSPWRQQGGAVRRTKGGWGVAAAIVVVVAVWVKEFLPQGLRGKRGGVGE